MLLFGFINCFSQTRSNINIYEIDSLISAYQMQTVVEKLGYLNQADITPKNVHLHLKLTEALEVADYNETALNNSLKLLNTYPLKPGEKAKLYLINARLYEKSGNRELTKRSLDNCYLMLNKSPDEIVQQWHVRMSSYYRVFFPEKKDSAIYYAKKSLNFKTGEVASAYFLNAFLSDKFEDKVYYLQKSIDHYLKINNKRLEGTMYLNIAKAYLSNGNLKKYEFYTWKGIEILKKLRSFDDKVSVYRTLKEFYTIKQDYKKVSLYGDSLMTAQKKLDSVYNFTAISLLEKKYQNENLQSEISRVNELVKQKEKTEKIEKSKNWILTILSLILFFFIMVVGYMTIKINIKRKNLAQKSLLLEEKNTKLDNLAKYNSLLLKETNHRVKNNLAMLSGIIRIQINRSEDPRLVSKLTEIVGRINSISLIHKNLYHTENFSKVNIREIINEIIISQNNFASPLLINKIQTNIDEIQIEIEKMLPLTLIVNELLTNSIKYALRTDEDYVKLSIKYLTSSNEIMLCLEDSGEGFDLQHIVSKKESMGLQLVTLLSEQLDGNLNFVKNSDSFSVTLSFKV